MTSKQDRQGVRKPSDLEQKYEFGQTLSQLEEASKQNSERISKQGQELTDYMTSSGSKLSSIENDLDTAEDSISLLKAVTSSLQTRMTNAERKDKAMSQSISGLAQSLSESDKSSGDSFKKLETAVADLTEKLEAVEKTLTSLEERVTALEST